ncbi:exopolyphosphatase/guanosine-5'-triphosphate,3'-diphosphate pyrophosphatase [Acetoanaerobium pronyense]|uniref:Exopolyphosphatase/guanosine-5'-triphosphate, 3'-diphosphate pyrophosphatase n=1 Tax=Acetoanaerobium pronyense TaxID=1482736 RepID=A0ABS4KER2_9FIRM|nr:HD domain-containing protein [Acetoanaerobium pronyense]MBP2026249.1 exopolyphosphatase/guanosine-5'-triphosphate,3'-diphosphate pyrophosphatase [Acetoanaerobium pronyense]
MAGKDKLVASIDVGSNSIRMLIAEIGSKGNIKILEELKKSIDIGKDTYNTGKVSLETIKDTVKILKNFSKLLDEYNIKNYRAVTTSGIRESKNKDYVIEQIKSGTGLDVEIINNSQERLLTYKAIREYLPEASQMRKEGVLIIDIGSGGVEVTLYNEGYLCFTEYVKIGSQRLKETLSEIESDTMDFPKVLEDYIESKSYLIKENLLKYNVSNFIGLGGELSSIYKACKKTDEEKSMKKLSKDSLKEFYKEARNLSSEELSEILGINEKQSEMVVPTLAISQKFIEMTKSKDIYVPRASLRHGILADMADEAYDTQRKIDFIEDIRHSIVDIAIKYRVDYQHVEHVKDMALKIFDKTKKIHFLSERDRLLMEIASLLHDIGKYVNVNNYQVYSFHIIKALDIMGISDREMDIIAHVAKFHADEEPQGSKSYEVLSYDNKIRISKMAAIVKLADALDLSHKNKIKSIDVKIKGSTLTITASSNEEIPLEKWYFHKISDFFEEVMGYKPILKQKGF